MTSKRRFCASICVVCILLPCIVLCMSACTSTPSTPPVKVTPEPTDTPQPTSTSVPTTETTVEEQPEQPTETPTAPLTATPTPCGPPAGWVVYTIQRGDTLFSLARKTQTTVDQIKLANCLDSNWIIVGQKLYLPYLPPSPTAVPPTWTSAPPTPTDMPAEPVCASSFSCEKDGLPPLNLAPGGPNDPTFEPCQLGEPIEFDTDDRIVYLGQRRYFYICIPNPVSATLKRSDDLVQDVGLLTTMPNLDLKMEDAQAIVAWAPLPSNPTGIYELTVTDDGGTKTVFPFLVDLPEDGFILVVPPSGPPGTVFQVYYVNFAINTTPTFHFYGEDEPRIGGQHELLYHDSWYVAIDQPLAGDGNVGWGQQSLVSVATDPLAAYSITDDDADVFILFWLR